MRSDLSKAIHDLSQIRIFDYFKNRSMPDFVEPLTIELINSFASLSQPERHEVLDAVSPELASVLGWYARKVAGRAVRERSGADLRNGLIAVALGVSKADFTDMLAPLALLYNSAVELKEDPKMLFEAGSRLSTKPVQELFEGFLNRPVNQKSIVAFGFSEGTGPHGFDYFPLLPEYGGPTPFDNAARVVK